jgi:hypothetical protein
VRRERGAAGTEERAERITSYVSTHRRTRWRIATCIALQATLFNTIGWFSEIYTTLFRPIIDKFSGLESRGSMRLSSGAVGKGDDTDEDEGHQRAGGAVTAQGHAPGCDRLVQQVPQHRA